MFRTLIIIKLPSYRSLLCGSLLTLSILQFLTYECHTEWSGGLERERKSEREREERRENEANIYCVTAKWELDTFWGRTQEGQSRHGQMRRNEMCAITRVVYVSLRVCTRIPVSLWYLCGHGQSLPYTLSPSALSPISAPLSLSRSLSHTLHTMPLRE